MKKFATIVSILLLLGGTWSKSCGEPAYCRRIISLAPSVTEILFALDLGDRVVGVTRYCTFPAEALTRAKVGGYYDPNYEEILRLKPDLVVMLTEDETAKTHLQSLHIATLQVGHNTIADIVNSIRVIGKACGAIKKADSLAAAIRGEIEGIRSRTAGYARPRVMVSVGRGMGSITDLCIAGKNTFYDELIDLAGGVNAITAATIQFPMVSPEGIYRINPQIIIDMVPDLAEKKMTTEKILSEWNTMPDVEAVKTGRIYLFDQSYAEIPGPRFIEILRQLARVIHPELK